MIVDKTLYGATVLGNVPKLAENFRKGVLFNSNQRISKYTVSVDNSECP